MTSPTQVLKSVGPKLVPFFKTVAIYFVLYIPVERPSWFAMAIKCLPILSLVIFVLLHGMSLGDEYAFSRRILTGLIFSCIGDALLVWPQYFVHGMAAFGLAQIMYTAAFGFKPLNASLGAGLYCLAGVVTILLLPGLSGPLLAGVPLYNFLLVTTVWRAIARVQLFKELWTWTKLCSCAGGITFAISDGLIGFHHFYSPIPYSQALIMVTYYAAQLGIALSVVDSKADYKAKQDALNNSIAQSSKTNVSHDDAADDCDNRSAPIKNKPALTLTSTPRLTSICEVYVLDDGGEVDLDLGNYERFLDVTLHRDNNITTGKIYQHVINKERNGSYLGKTVQVVPHITDAIQEWVERVAAISVSPDGAQPEVCIVELGGTIGDIEGMPFVEAFRQFQFRVKKENFCVAHVSLVPQPKSTGESKTKPTQSSVRELRGLGLSPDLIVCRSENPINHDVKVKISSFCHVEPEQVICIHDLSSIYQVPIVMEQQRIVEFFRERLQLDIPLPRPKKFMHKWKDLAERAENLRRDVRIALVGKYTKLEDSYASVTKALQHSAIAVGYNLKLSYIEAASLEKGTKLTDPVLYHEAWQMLCRSDGVLVPGGFGKRGIEGKLEACRWCRETVKPFLGICLGLQVAVIEFARNVLGLEDAETTEINPETKNPVVIDMPEHTKGQMGGTMRLGKRVTEFEKKDSILKYLYGKEKIEERHRHRYEVNPDYVPKLEAAGLNFVAKDDTKQRMEIMELKGHPYYVATQFHPEYLSRPLAPSPPFLGLILASCGKLQSYIARGCRLSPKQLSDDEFDSDYDDNVGDDKVLMSLKNKLGNLSASDTASEVSSSTVNE